MEQSFSTRIKKLRNSLNITQAELATELNTTQAALSAYERGERTPSLEILMTISKKYSVSIDWLCGLTEKTGSCIETYSDLYNTLFMIEKSVHISFQTISREGVIMGSNWEPEPCIEYLQSLYFDNPKIAAFLEEWEKMKTLHDNNTIDDEVYSLWIEKTLKKKENSHVKLNGNKYELSLSDSEELPFNP